MIVKILKSNALVLNYEYLSDDGMIMKKRQSFTCLPLAASDDDLYSVGIAISNVLKSPAKTIQQSTTSILTEG